MKFDGIYHGHYEVSSRARPSTDWNQRRGFVLPGQGSSQPGMFAHQLQSLKEFKDVFQIADRVCSYLDLAPVSNYLLRPTSLPQEKIHIYRNCALYCCEVAAGYVLLQRQMTPKAITGHSFGECAGLVLSGLLDFEAVFNAVVHRNVLCPPANELGFMVALSGEPARLGDVLGLKGVYLANINSPKQIAISVANESKSAVLDALRNGKIPHVLLAQLPQPYHSPLMEPTRVKLFERLSELGLTAQSPQFDFYSGVRHGWITSSNYQDVDFVDLFARQITEPLDFVDQISALQKIGVDHFYEVGPGKMLETSIRSIAKINAQNETVYKDAETLIRKLASIEKEEAPLNPKLAQSKWFTKIKSVIQTVTGYKDDEIEIGQSFQHDLGIDSIKKAEILFKIISNEQMDSNSDLSITKFSTIYQAVEYLENYSDVADPLRVNHSSKTELLYPVWKAAPLPIYDFQSGAQKSDRILRLENFNGETFAQSARWAKDNRSPSNKSIAVFQLSQELEFSPQYLSEIKKAFASAPFDATQPFYVTLLDRTKTRAFQPLGNLLKSLERESHSIRVQYIHSSDRNLTDREIALEAENECMQDVDYQQDVRHKLELAPLLISSTANRTKPIHLIAFGGSRGITFEILKNFPVRDGDRLLLVGRSKASSPELALGLAELKSRWTHFDYRSVDARNEGEVLGLVQEQTKSWSAPDFVINSCGIEVSKNFVDRDSTSIADEFHNKIQPMQNIERATRASDIQKVLHFTSVVSQFGNKGQAVYSFCNSWMESQALPERHHTLAWAPWENVGMTTNEGILRKVKETGVSLVSPQEGCDLVYQILFSREALPTNLVPMDSKDQSLFHAERLATIARPPVLGEMYNKFESVFFKDVFLKNESFLSGHKIRSQVLIPASYFLSQMTTLGRNQFQRLTAIRNFTVQNLAMVENDHCHLKTQAFFRHPHEVSIYSVVPHCLTNLDPSFVIAKELSPKFVPTHQIDMASMYKNYEELENKFILMQKGFLNKDRDVEIELDVSRMPTFIGDSVFDFYLGVFEVALQSLTVAAYFKVGSTASLPTSIGTVAFAEALHVTPKVLIRPILQQIGEREMRADILILNENSELICRLSDVGAKHYHFSDWPVKTTAIRT